MNKKTLVGLIICNFVIHTLGNGLLSLMPLFVQLHGASEGFSGVYVAFAYFCLAVGTMIGGKLSDRISNRRLLLIVIGILIAPVTFILGRVESLFAVIVMTGLQWGIAGFCLAITGTIMGREAVESERGRVFGFIGVSMGMGALVGGFTIGPMVDAWGYMTMFSIMSVFLLILPIAAIITVRETAVVKTEESIGHKRKPSAIEISLIILFAAQFLGMVANGVGNMARTISMNQLHFSSTAMTSTVAVLGIVSIPLALLLGSIAGFIYSGYAFINLGMKVSLLIASCGGLCAAALILLIHTKSVKNS